MSQPWTYLDYNASTPMAPEVVEVMQRSLEAQAHATSKHPAGLKAGQFLSEARRQVAEAVQAEPDEITFCSGSTEAANHVIKGIAFSPTHQGKVLHFITSAVDHPATVAPMRFLERLGHQVTILPVDHTGSLRSADLEAALRPNTALVSLIHGQNEVGTVLALEEVGELCRSRGIPFHVDASQSFGKVPVSVKALKADFLQLAGHKIYAPKGIGALYIRRGQSLEPLLHGGGHESGVRSGTPSQALAAGLGEACRLVQERGLIPREPADRLWQLLHQELGENVRRNGHPERRLPNVVHVTFRNRSGQALLDQAHICASTGAACHSATSSPVLVAMGLSAAEAAGSVRLSSGRHTTMEEAESAALRLVQAARDSQLAISG